MSERERTDPDAIDFDFFDDAPTEEAAREEAEPRRRRRLRGPAPPTGGNPLVRRAALVVGAILLPVVLILWVNSCRADAKTAEYESYMSDVGEIGGESAEIGNRLNQLIFSAGVQVEDLQNELDGLRQAQTQTVRRAEALDPPGSLREQQESFVEALQYRESGLNGLATALTSITDAEGASDAGGGAGEAAGQALAEQANRLLASDVVYADSFQARAQQVMDDEGVTGVDVPDSDFVANAELSSPASWALIVERLTRPPARRRPARDDIAGVRVLPGGEELSRTEENTVQASDSLAFEVLVENSGESQEAQIKVTLTLQQSPEPIQREATIDAINPGDTKSVSSSSTRRPSSVGRSS